MVFFFAAVLCLVMLGWSIYSPTEKAQQSKEAQKIESSLPTVPVPRQSAPAVPVDAFPAVIRIPRLGEGWVKPVYEGVDDATLEKGIGHYPTTALPGQEGNTGFAGHRSGWGNPLLDADNIKKGDVIQLKSATGTWNYKVVSTYIVLPENIDVLAPRKGKWLTLTTCWPKWGNSKRLIIQAELTTTQK
jgi:sortase A